MDISIARLWRFDLNLGGPFLGHFKASASLILVFFTQSFYQLGLSHEIGAEFLETWFS